VKVAKLSDVKDDLSRYVDAVRKGGRVRILVRGVPAADLVPVDHGADSGFSPAETAELEREGVIRRGKPGWPKALDRPGPRLPARAAIDAVVRERREGR
jgi:prevent-host-death family protein